MTLQFQTGTNSLGNATWSNCGDRAGEFLTKACAYKAFDLAEVNRRLAGGFTVGYDRGYNGVLCIRDLAAVEARAVRDAEKNSAIEAQIFTDRAAAAQLANDRG